MRQIFLLVLEMEIIKVGYVMGQDLNYFVTPYNRNTIMYCRKYGLENLTAKSKGKMIFLNLEFDSYNFRENLLEIGKS